MIKFKVTKHLAEGLLYSLVINLGQNRKVYFDSETNNINMSEGNIRVDLNYNRDDGIRPFKFGRPRTKKEQMIFDADEGGPRKFVPSVVRNARNGTFTLDKNSFELIQDETSLSTNDFYNSQLVEKVYYKEVAESIKNATGASAVQIYHYQVIRIKTSK